MSVSISRSLACLIAISAVVACAAHRNYTTTSGGEVYLSPYPPAVLGPKEVQLLRGLSDGNILGHLIEVDSVEIAAADTALRFSKSDTVLKFATLTRFAHETDLKREREISRQTGIVSTIDVVGLKASHMAASLDSVRFASDLTIDRHYITSQVQLHRHLLAELDMLDGVARNGMIRAHIEELMPIVRDHLERARTLAVAKGIELKGL